MATFSAESDNIGQSYVSRKSDAIPPLILLADDWLSGLTLTTLPMEFIPEGIPMRHTTLSVVIEVIPASTAVVIKLLEKLRAAQEQTPQATDQSYDRLRNAVPMLHFMSITVAPDALYDPLLVLEVNFDGEESLFWDTLEAAIGLELRDVLRHCKQPSGNAGSLFEKVMQSGSKLGPLFSALSVRPIVQHQGNRGLGRQQIIQEGKLFNAVQVAVDALPVLPNDSAVVIHRNLRETLRPQFKWLGTPVQPRIDLREKRMDTCRLWAFGAAVVTIFFLAVLMIHLLLQALLPWPESVSGGMQWGWQTTLFVFIAGAILASVASLLRHLERTDSVNDAPRFDEDLLRDMAKREDEISQNHMISIVHIKPGMLRAVLARLVLTALGLWLRVTAQDGYLASMRTIHFAHWAILNNGGRLMFHSNYDGSWESYLDDFIEKAHAGLTAAWTHGVGFPRTKWLFMDGATQGRKFKDWARYSMSPSQFWFSAYKNYSVNQIERHARIAQGLRKSSLTLEEAQLWALDL